MAGLKVGFLTERMLRGFGVDLVVDQLSRGLSARGHGVTVYSSVSDESFAADDYRIKLIPTSCSSFFPHCDFAAQRHLAFLNGEDIDVWLVQTFPFFSLLPRLKAPAVAVEYGVSSSAGFPPKLRANFAYIRFTQTRLYYRWARRIVAISEFLKQELPAGLRDKTSVIYPGADHYRRQADSDAAGRDLRSGLGIGDDEVLMLYVGRLSSADQPYKGTGELVALYRRLRRENAGLRLLMVGFGGAREKEWLESEGVTVLLNAPAGQMPAIFSACDLYVTASRWEGFDLPLAEAQAFGKPVVALRIGAHPEVVADGDSGFLVDNMEGMYQKVQELSGDAALRAELGRNAGAKASRFNWEDAFAAYDRLVREVARS